MKIGVISDTHDDVQALRKAIKEFNTQETALVLHCGDWVAPFMAAECRTLNCDIVGIFGNNDGDLVNLVKQGTKKVDFNNRCAEKEIGGRKLAIYHGDSAPLLESLLGCGKYDAVFSGHTHIALIEKVNKTLHVNPGSTSCPFGNSSSVAIYNTEDNSAEIIQFN